MVVAAVMVGSFVRAANRKKRDRAAAPLRPGAATAATHNTATLLNGVPLKSYDNPHGSPAAGFSGVGFANERMRVEAELKRQLDALDAARRAGQVSAEQYAGHREAIFKNF